MNDDTIPAARWSRPPLSAASTSRLTTREREIGCLLASGLSILNVASRLGISEQTVAVHTRRTYRKLGVHNRVDLARHFTSLMD